MGGKVCGWTTVIGVGAPVVFSISPPIGAVSIGTGVGEGVPWGGVRISIGAGVGLLVVGESTGGESFATGEGVGRGVDGGLSSLWVLPPSSVLELPPSSVLELPPSSVFELPPSSILELPPSSVLELPPSSVFEPPPSSVFEEELPPSSVLPSFKALAFST